MKRQIISIDEEKCTGCGLCVPNCHEGALQIIDGKARLISDLFCDGLGACIGHCPEDAITIIEREAEPYDEYKVMEQISKQGKNTIFAHLEHLKEHGETKFLNQGIKFLKDHNIETGIDMEELLKEPAESAMCGCPGAAAVDFRADSDKAGETKETNTTTSAQKSELRQWPVQLHLVNPMAGYFQNADVLLAADCTAFAMGNFHAGFLKGKTLTIACPKLDSNKETYLGKLKAMIDEAHINTLTVMIMEVPCCGGLTQIAQMAQQNANRKIPLKEIVVSIRGEVLREEWS